MTSFTSPVHFLSGVFIVTSLIVTSAPRVREHLHSTNSCTKRKVLSLTKPKGKIYKTKNDNIKKSHRNYITGHSHSRSALTWNSWHWEGTPHFWNWSVASSLVSYPGHFHLALIYELKLFEATDGLSCSMTPGKGLVFSFIFYLFF